MKLNNFELIDRFNRPTTMGRAGLRSIFINDGVQADPLYISSVAIFTKLDQGSSSLLDANGLVSAVPLMQFYNTNEGGVGVCSVADTTFDATGYNPLGFNCSAGLTCGDVSGIYRYTTSKPGEFICVLDGGLDLSGNFGSQTIANAASAVNDYIDVWTVKFTDTSDWQVLINEFSLYGSTFFSVTQPLILKTRNNLATKHVTLLSKMKLKVPTEITVENKDIDSSIINIFKESVLANASCQIVKLNDDVSLPSRVTLKTFTSTTGMVDITSDNTIIYVWDTSNLAAEVAAAGGGAATGTYTFQVKYDLIDETIYSPTFPLIVS